MTEVATVPLAVDDFVPVALAGVGAVWLARTTGRDRALLGAVLILAGGLCKASWKLVLAATGDDVPHVNQLLFCLLAPGFALLAAALLADVRPARAAAVCRGADVSIGVALGLAVLTRSTVPLLVLTVLASTATGLLALLAARRRDDLPAVALFALQLVLAYALVPFAGAGQSLAHQWWEQSLNTLGQGAFALGAWRLLAPARTRSYA